MNDDDPGRARHPTEEPDPGVDTDLTSGGELRAGDTPPDSGQTSGAALSQPSSQKLSIGDRSIAWRVSGIAVLILIVVVLVVVLVLAI